MKMRLSRRTVLPAAGALVVLLALLAAAAATGRLPGRPAARVGRVNMEAVFHAYTGSEAFALVQARAEEINELLEQALADRDQEKMREHYGKLQEMQLEFAQHFEAEVNRAAAEVSRAQGLLLIVNEIVYEAEHARIPDVTEAIIRAAGLVVEAPPHGDDCPCCEDGEDPGDPVSIIGELEVDGEN